MNALELSFEFFPPKTPDGVEKLRATRAQLAPLKPKFVSVTIADKADVYPALRSFFGAEVGARG